MQKNAADEIATVSYALYVKSRRMQERDMRNWLEAERIVFALNDMSTESGGDRRKHNDPDYVGSERRSGKDRRYSRGRGSS